MTGRQGVSTHGKGMSHFPGVRSHYLSRMPCSLELFVSARPRLIASDRLRDEGWGHLHSVLVCLSAGVEKPVLYRIRDPLQMVWVLQGNTLVSVPANSNVEPGE